MKNTDIKTPWGEIGYITYKRTYSRTKEDGSTEEFPETIERCIQAANKQLGCRFTSEEQDELRDLMLSLKCLPAGRFLWQLGTTTVDNLGLFSLMNCAFIKVDHPVKPFIWAMDALMLGSGVGFSVRREDVYQLPKLREQEVIIKRQDDASADFIVPDTREGWCKLLELALEAFFVTGKGFTYSTHCIRPFGTPIKGFGGVSSGPEPLVSGIEDICGVLARKRGMRVSSVDCLDVMNIIGRIVVSGNIRRSAQIAIGDYDDIDFINAKRWDKYPNIPNWRIHSNNSVYCTDTSLLSEAFWETYRIGEPMGLVNIDLIRSCGRLGEGQYTDNAEGVNPCGEQGLVNGETCCLAETFLSNCVSKEEFFRGLYFVYKINKGALNLPCHSEITWDIVSSNQRMGIGATGILQCSEEQLSWLSEGYVYLRKLDKEYSKERGYNECIKLTTIKPSGTLSLLPGVVPGCHPSPAGPFYIRRMRMQSNSPLLAECEEKGYHIEYQKNMDGTDDLTTKVVSFPCKVPKGTPIAGSISAIEHLKIIRRLQTDWSDNCVSASVYYTLDELDGIKEWLNNNYTASVKSVSFLLYNDHGFVQAPYETISEELYNEMKSNIKGEISLVDELELPLSECEKGHCPIK